MFPVAVTSFWALMLYAAYSDFRSYTLPNFISIVLFIGFLLALVVIQPSLPFIGWHMGVGFVVFAIGFGLFAVGIFGGGDVKVIAALAFWFGPNNFFAFFTIMAIAGGVLAVGLLLFRKIKLPEAWSQNETIRGLHDPQEGIPYGIAIAIAALFEFPKTQIYSALAAL